MSQTETESGFPLDGRPSVIPRGYNTLVEFSVYAGRLDSLTLIKHDGNSQRHSTRGSSVTMSNPGDLFVGHFEWEEDDPCADLIEFYEVTIPADVATLELRITDDENEEANILTTNPIRPGDNWKYVVPICVAEGEQVVIYSKRE